MTVWNKPWSWSKISKLMSCPKRLQYELDQVPPSNYGTNFHAIKGTISQKVFELYFNNGFNLKPGGQEQKIVLRILDKLLTPEQLATHNPNFSHNQSEDQLKEEIREDVIKAHELFVSTGLITKPIKSEVKWRATFRDMRIFAAIDFLYESRRGHYVYDGKGHQQENADEGQVKYYALNIAASNKTVAGGGFLYWKHGYRDIDVSPKAIHEFVEERIDPIMPLIRTLKTGTEDLPANPGSGCFFCNHRGICKDYPKSREPVENGHLLSEVDL